MAAFTKKRPTTIDARAAAADNCSAYVAIVLDITGSMGAQIEGVKRAVQQLIPALAENPNLGIVIITFTEGGSDMKKTGPACYVSVDTFSDPTEADAFVRKITLSKPPGHPGVLAYGDDGDENAKAALHALRELDGSKATVAFFITDAGYHRSKLDSPTAKAEEEFLGARSVSDTDFYALFDSVLAHFAGNLVVVPIVYNFSRHKANTKQAYGQMAMTSGSGVVIEPVQSTARTLALTMGTFVTRLLGQLNGQTDLPPEPPQEMLVDLRLLDTSGMTRIERDIHTPPGPYPREGDAGELFESAMTRAVTAFKMSWKRCIDVDKVSLLRQLVFGLTAAKFLLAVTTGNPISGDLRQRLRDSYPEVLEAVPEEHRGQIKATPEVIEVLAAELATATSAAGSASGGTGGDETMDALTLETVRETLGAALDDEIRRSEGDEAELTKPTIDPLEAVFAMVHGIFVNVYFPAGVNGKPNFADAWSAMIDKHSFDVVSAESAVRLFKDHTGYDFVDDEPWYETGKRGGGVAVGMMDRRKYNGFVPLMDEGDPVKTAVMRIFSGLQVLNLLQMTVLEGSPGGFLPNMYPGMVAATLARVIRTSAGGSWAGVEGAAGEANDRLASQMIFSLRGIMGSPARTARLRLVAGKADPSNPMSKFLMVLCKQPRGCEVDEEAFRAKMRLVLNEWVAAIVQLHFGKATPENDEKFHTFLLRKVVPLQAVFGKETLDIDPLEKLHPLEVMGGKDGRGFPALDGWKSTGLANLSNTDLYKDVKRLVDRCRAVFGCLDMEYDVDEILLDYVVYRFRTARYDFIERPGSPKAGGGDTGSHEPIQDMPSTLTLLVKIYRKALHPKLAAMREARSTYAMNQLKANVVSARAVTEETRSIELLGTKHSLQRTDVPSILTMAGYDKNLAFVEELVLGDWTPEPPQCLRRFSGEIIDGVEAAGGGGAGGLSERLRDAISQQELCNRTEGCNRHGHTADLRFPGPMGWTKAYAAARRSNLKKAGHVPTSGPARKIIPQMKRYTDFGTELLRRLDDEPDDGKGVAVTPAPPSPTASGKKAKKGKRGGGGGGVVVVTIDQLKKDVRRVLYGFDDANCLPLVRKKIERLGVPPRILDGL